MEDDVINVAKLLTTWDLDAGPLKAGLKDIDVELSDSAPKFMSINALIKQLGIESQFASDKQKALAGDMRAAAQLEVEVRRDAAAKRKQIEAEAAEIEKVQLQEMAQYRRQDKINEDAARRRYIGIWSRINREAEEANLAFSKQVSESIIGQQIAQAQATIAAQEAAGSASGVAGAKMLLNYRKAAVEGQALNQLFGIGIPSSMARLIAFSPMVSAALASVFDVVMVGAFLDILYQVGNKINDLARDWEGFDAASTKAWEDARRGALRDQDDLQKHRDLMRSINEAGLKGAELDKAKERNAKAGLTDREKRVHDLEAQIGPQQTLLDRAKEELQKQKDSYQSMSATAFVGARLVTPALDEIKRQGRTFETATEDVKALREELRKLGNEEDEMRAKAQIDAKKAAVDGTKGTHHRIPGGDLHEEPYRLPWYLTNNAANAFRSQMGTFPMMNGAPGSSSAEQIIRTGMGGAGAALAPPTAGLTNGASSGSGGRGGITMQVTYAPVFKFDGVPADIEAFMRNKAEPQLVKDLENNTNKIRTMMHDALAGK